MSGPTTTRPVLLWDEVDQVSGDLAIAVVELDRLSLYARPHDEGFAGRLKTIANEVAALHLRLDSLNGERG